MNNTTAIDNALACLEPTAKTLNEEYDNINALIKRVQDTLREFNIGVHQAVTLAEDADFRLDDGQRVHREIVLAYRKFNSFWSFTVTDSQSRLVTDDDGNKELVIVGEPETTLLSSCSRGIRTLAIEAMPELLDLINESAEEEIEDLRRVQRIPLT